MLLTACSSYDFTINDRVVYTPDPLFTDFDIPDPALRECVREAIDSNKVTVASELAAVECTNAGIDSLAGLATFTEIEQLTLSSNNIKDISELASLTVLQVLYLDNNKVIDAVPLYQLPALNRVDLSANPELRCPASGSLFRVDTVILPRHCR
jgi:hypothetical protein